MPDQPDPREHQNVGEGRGDIEPDASLDAQMVKKPLEKPFEGIDMKDVISIQASPHLRSGRKRSEFAQGRMKKKTITEEELNAAISHFLKNGGMIDKLPDEKTAGRMKVGHKYQATELGGESSRT